MHPKILFVISQHGNEPLGRELVNFILARHPALMDSIDVIVGNPEAVEKNVRFVETDLNRSWGFTEDLTHEQKRAQELQRYISHSPATLVLDLHTTATNQPRCFIAHSTSGTVGELIAASHIRNVVVMPDHIAEPSLIGKNAHAVSIEVSNSELNDELYESLATDIEAYLSGRYPHAEKDVFEVDEKILKSEYAGIDFSDARNFELHKQTNIYPVLIGENSYKKQTDYLGFRAKRKQTKSF